MPYVFGKTRMFSSWFTCRRGGVDYTSLTLRKKTSPGPGTEKLPWTVPSLLQCLSNPLQKAAWAPGDQGSGYLAVPPTLQLSPQLPADLPSLWCLVKWLQGAQMFNKNYRRKAPALDPALANTDILCISSNWTSLPAGILSWPREQRLAQEVVSLKQVTPQNLSSSSEKEGTELDDHYVQTSLDWALTTGHRRQLCMFFHLLPLTPPLLSFYSWYLSLLPPLPIFQGSV